MHHVQDCSRVLEVREGGWWYPLYFFHPPVSSTGLIKTLELCSCGKEKKNEIFFFWNLKYIKSDDISLKRFSYMKKF